MKREIFTATLLAVALLSGCGDRGGDCEDSNASGVRIEYKDPVAMIDVTAERYTAEADNDNNASTLAFRWYNADDPIYFDANRSRDLDSEGSSAVRYHWDVKNEDNTTMSDDCIHKSEENNGSRLVVRICEQARDTEFEKFSVKLTVTDNEDKNASDYKLITIY